MIPLHLDNDSLSDLFEQMDGIVISGGGDVDPKEYGAERSVYTGGVDGERDRVEIQLARWAVEQDKPLLAICRGMQVLNVALGGTLIQDIRDEVPNSLRHDANEDEWFNRIAHEVEVVPGSKLYTALDHQERIEVNSLHHQALKQVAKGLEVVACAPDGIIEGVEHPERHFMVGVQWHPEALADRYSTMRHLFQSFVKASHNR